MGHGYFQLLELFTFAGCEFQTSLAAYLIEVFLGGEDDNSALVVALCIEPLLVALYGPLIVAVHRVYLLATLGIILHALGERG